MPNLFTITPDGALTAPSPVDAEAHQAALRWQRHLEAGRLTAAKGPLTRPEIAMNRARTEAILGAHAAALRAALAGED